MRPPRDRLEKDEEKDIVKAAKARGYYTRKLAFIDSRGGPDRLFAKPGRLFLLEVKKRDETPSAQQHLRHTELREAGIETHWVDRLEDALVLLT